MIMGHIDNPGSSTVEFVSNGICPVKNIKANVDMVFDGNNLPVFYPQITLSVNGTDYSFSSSQFVHYYQGYFDYTYTPSSGSNFFAFRTRWAEVDLGSLNWVLQDEPEPDKYYENGFTPFFYTEDLANLYTKVAENDRYSTTIKAYANGYQFYAFTSKYAFGDIDHKWNDLIFAFEAGTDGQLFMIRNNSYDTAEDFKIAVSGVKLIYYKNSLTSTGRTLAELIQTQVGTNTISCNDGDIESVVYYTPVSSKCHARITFAMQNKQFTDEDFDIGAGITLSSFMNPDINYKIGRAFSKEIRFGVFKSNKTSGLNWREGFTLEFGHEENDTTIWTTIGDFGNVQVSTDGASKTFDVVAYDKMYLFDALSDDFIKYLQNRMEIYGSDYENYTFNDFYNDLAKCVGVEIEEGNELPVAMDRSFFANKDKFFSRIEKGTTLRQLLSYIAEINCCYAKITNEGKLKLIWFTQFGTTVQADDEFSVNLTYLHNTAVYYWSSLENKKWGSCSKTQWDYFESSSETGIRAVRSYDSGKQNAIIYPENYTSNKNIYSIINNPFFLNSEIDIVSYEEELAILTAIRARFVERQLYYDMDVVAVGNYMVEPGDMITITDLSGYQLQYMVFNIRFLWNGDSECEYITQASSNYNEDLEISQVLSKETISKNTINQLEEGLENSVKLTGDQEIEGEKTFTDSAVIGSNASVGFAQEELGKVGSILLSSNSNMRSVQMPRMAFAMKSLDTETNKPSDNTEQYLLPAPDANLQENSSYDILTTKNPVAIENGGTGGTTASEARENLGLGAIAVEGTPLAISSGGSGMTGVSTDSVTTNGITASCRKWGKVVQVTLSGTFTATIAKSTNFITLPSGYRPAAAIRPFGKHNGNVDMLYVGTAGGINNADNDCAKKALYSTFTFVIS